MSLTFTPRMGIPIVPYGYGTWTTPWAAQMNAIDGIAVGAIAVTFTEQPSASLNVKVASGSYRTAAGGIGSYAGTASQGMTSGSTNYVYLTDTGTLTVSTSSFPTSTNYVALAIVVAGSTTITSIADARVLLASQGVGTKPLTSVTNVTSSWTVDTTKAINFSNYTAGAITATLPAASTVPAGTVTTVVDLAGNAATHNITITRAGSDTINGGTTFVINTNYGGARLFCDGVSAWIVLP